MAVGNEYAKALFSLSEECATSDLILSEIKEVSEILSKNPDYVKLLDTPALTRDEKLSLIDGAFGTLSEILVNLIKILCERHSVHTFFGVARAYAVLYNEARGIEEVEAVSAVAMTDSQISRLSEKLSSMTGKKIILKNTVDPKILGGVKLRYSGIQLDGSVKTRLDKFSESLKNTVI